ncbi:MAG: MarR family transcriptional regulator [Actinobacteria bacterium]|nr:MarR family transcriptional regulator [Actinomycetota bacterium]
MATARPTTPAAPPSFLSLAADPLRWRLLIALAHGDLRVRELAALVDRPQSLVSYHLSKLSAAGVLTRRKSSADGRDSYYALDLARCGDLLAASAGGLHPGLRLAVPPRGPRADGGPIRGRVLFLCTGNSGRSQIAEALAADLSGGTVEARSAGSDPKPLHPLAVRVMGERGIDIAGRRSKHLDEFAGERFDFVVTLCDRVREVCPEFPGEPDTIHWSIPDPAREGRTSRQSLRAFERTAAELAVRIPYLLDLIGSAASTPGGDRR